MAVQIGDMRFQYKDFTEDVFNESVDCTYEVWGANEGAGMSMDQYWSMCRRFAAAMGFGEETINEWFGA